MAIYDDWRPLSTDREDAHWTGEKQYEIVLDGGVAHEATITDMTEYTNTDMTLTRLGAAMVNDMADAINNIVIDLQDVATESLVYEDYRFTITYAAGTNLGERAGQFSTACSKEGYVPVAAFPVSVGNSTAYNPTVFLSGTTLYCNAYRASTSAVSGSVVTARVLFLKTR